MSSRSRRLTAAAGIAVTGLAVGSFTDESAQVAFALSLTGSSTASGVSALLVLGMLGAVAAGPVSARVLGRGVRETVLIPLVLVLEAVTIVVAGAVAETAAVLVASFVLGLLGSLLWAAVMVLVPRVAAEDQLGPLNRIVATVRNLGYVAGPALGGFLYATGSGTQALIVIGTMAIASAAVVAAALRVVLAGSDATVRAADHDEGSRPGRTPTARRRLAVRELFATPGIPRALGPLLVTVLATSVLNVLLIVHVRDGLEIGAGAYGLIVAALSVGLVIGPAVLGGIAARRGESVGASAAAAVIGLAMSAIGLVGSVPALLVCAFGVGLANGVQNTLMSTYMMKTVAAERRSSLMPAYLAVLQVWVLVGYLAAGCVTVSASGTVLTACGATAALVGLIGIRLNLTSAERPRVAEPVKEIA